MHFSTTVLLSLTGAALTTPVAAAALGSKKNVYLATCITRGRDCNIPILCDLLNTITTADTSSAAAETFGAVIYYDGPATAGASPSDVGILDSARAWEGAARRTSLSVGDFESRIQRGAGDLAKSQIAGTAKLGDEELICFRDGEATFLFRQGLLGRRGTSCRADYWCASIEV